MPSALLANASDISAWARRPDASRLLPELIRRLIHATATGIERISFRAGDSVHVPGWDGIVVARQETAFVPAGTSGWELGKGRGTADKADDDYVKRCNDPLGIEPEQGAFMFATPRRWAGKDKWISDREGKGPWRIVRAYDADDIEDWLQLAPAVHVWFSTLIGKRPEDALDLESYWQDWSCVTQPPTRAEFLLSGRAKTAQEIQEWLRGSAVSIALQAESRDEALAVLAAATGQLAGEERIRFLARAVVVRSVAAWERLATSAEPLILIPAFDARDALARATRTGHRVAVPLGRADSSSDTTLEVARLALEEAAKILVAGGMVEGQARTLAVLARRSLMSFRRKLAVRAEVQQPEWARPHVGRSLLPALLAGTWDDASEGDREVLAVLAGIPYQHLSDTLVRWSTEGDPPVRRVGGTWFIASNEDAWSLLAKYLTNDDLKRFEDVVVQVLGAADPRFDLPQGQQWMARALGHTPRHSAHLREGLADTLAIMGARGDSISVSPGVSIGNHAKGIVRRLLESANADWRIWASLSHQLARLAEAVPDQFLTSVEDGLRGNEPVLLKLFREEKGGLFTSSEHTGLLWALETVAWSPEYLGHAALLLAKLARLDPGGKLENRPLRSLRQIFLLWHPQTSATLEQRLRVLDTIRQREPDVAWALLHQLPPRLYSFAMNNATPTWREWAPDPTPAVTHLEVFRGVSEVAARMLADVDEKGDRWKDLIESLPDLPADDRDKVILQLEGVDPGRLPPSDRLAIWDAVRKLISQHRSFADAHWAMGKDWVDRLDPIHERFVPEEPAVRYAYLFGNNVELAEGSEHDWQVHEEKVSTLRLTAIRAIHADAGLAGLLELSGRVERPDLVGIAAGQSNLLENDERELLCTHLASEDADLARFARGFVVGRVSSRGRTWGESRASVLSELPAQCADFLACLPCDAQTWDLAQKMGAEVERLYWGQVSPYLPSDPCLIERAAKKLLQYGRPFMAAELLGYHARDKQRPAPELVAEALERALETAGEHKAALNASFAWHVGELLDWLEESQGIPQGRVASLEWAFFPLLEHHKRGPKLLYREIARNPQFFAEIVALVFRAEGEPPRDLPEDMRARARMGYDLLDSCRTLPGMSDGGAASGRLKIPWPVRAVRVRFPPRAPFLLI